MTRRPPSRFRSINDFVSPTRPWVLEPTDLRPRIDAGEEAHLGSVDVARPGHHRLIDEGVTDLTLRLSGEPPSGFGGIPVRTEDIGAQVLEESLFGGRPDHLEPPQSMADRDPVLGLEHASDLDGASPPPFAGFVQPPRTVHAEVRMDRDVAVDATSRCLPRGATSRTTCPDRSAVAKRGTRRSVRVSTRSASASCMRDAVANTVSPSAISTSSGTAPPCVQPDV